MQSALSNDYQWNDFLYGWEISIKDNLIIMVSPMIGFASLDISDYPPNGCYLNRWFYHTINQAFIAAKDWVDQENVTNSEPVGWFRNPSTGRRIDQDGKMYIHW